MEPRLVDIGAQPERTALSWLRTAASITFAALFLFRYLIEGGHGVRAFLLGGAAVLIAPVLLSAGARRAERASKDWEQVSPVNPMGTLLVSSAVFLVGLIVSTSILLT